MTNAVRLGRVTQAVIHAGNLILALDFDTTLLEGFTQSFNDAEADLNLKIEWLKLEHEAWFRVLLYFSSFYILAVVSFTVYLADLAEDITTDIIGQDYLRTSFFALVILNVLTFVSHPAIEFLMKTAHIRRLFKKLNSA